MPPRYVPERFSGTRRVHVGIVRNSKLAPEGQSQTGLVATTIVGNMMWEKGYVETFNVCCREPYRWASRGPPFRAPIAPTSTHHSPYIPSLNNAVVKSTADVCGKEGGLRVCAVCVVWTSLQTHIHLTCSDSPRSGELNSPDQCSSSAHATRTESRPKGLLPETENLALPRNVNCAETRRAEEGRASIAGRCQSDSVTIRVTSHVYGETMPPPCLLFPSSRSSAGGQSSVYRA